MSRRSAPGTAKYGKTRLTFAGWATLIFAAVVGIWTAIYMGTMIDAWDTMYYSAAEGTTVIVIMVLQVLTVLAALFAAIADLRRLRTIMVANIIWLVVTLALCVALPLDTRTEISPWLTVFMLAASGIAISGLAMYAGRPRRAAAPAKDKKRGKDDEDKADAPVDELAARRPRRVA